MIKQISVRTTSSQQIVDLTGKVNEFLKDIKQNDGTCTIFTPHTTCALTTGEIGEGTQEDLLEVATKIIPRIKFRHKHNPSHAWSHMAASFIGTSLSLPFQNNELILGIWQQVLLVELDGPRERNIIISL